MSDDRVFRIFSEAIELPEQERGAFLDRSCGDDVALRREVVSLLAAEGKAGDFLDSAGLAGPLADAMEDRPDPIVGTEIGGYVVRGVIARGGMGVVYRAEQTSPRRDVALKLIGRGLLTPELRRRFEMEAQLLGRLQHPGIAQIIEAGVADLGHGDQPYFAMERIDGRTLLEHADEHRLDVRARLRLMIRVCEAVQHAHQKGVIHRDLKPANILVDGTGQPKVLDFGVARSTDPDLPGATSLTDHGTLVGTLAYMSPEQVHGNPAEIDTRSDVYGLGVVCCELLTGDLPHDVADVPFPEAVRRIAEDPPRRLSVAGRRFPADLQTILAKALETDRDRRYSSASELAADLRRFLDDEAIAARPPSTVYQLRKLVARNRLAAVLTISLLVLLLGFGVAMAVQASRIRSERDRAEREARVATRVSEFLGEVFRIPDPGEARGNSVTAREILDRGSDRIRSGLADAPEVQARLMLTMGNVYQGLGLMEQAEGLLAHSLEAEARVPGGDPESRVRSLCGLAWIHRSRGAYDEGIEAARQALDLAAASFPPDHPLHGNALVSLGVNLRERGDLDEAGEVLQEALDRSRRIRGHEHEDVARVLYHQGWLHHRQGQPDQALQKYEVACPMIERTFGDDHPMFAWCLNDRALVLDGQGLSDDAAAALAQSIAVWERILPPDHPNLAAAIDNLGSLHWRAGDFDAAAREYDRGLEMRRRTLGPEHVDVAKSQHNQALAYREAGRSEEAIALFSQAQATYARTTGMDTPDIRNSWRSLASLHERRGDVAAALRLYDREAASLERTGEERTMGVAGNLLRRGNCLAWLGRLPESEAALLRSLAIGEEVLGEDSARLTAPLLALAELRERQGDWDAAAVLVGRARALLQAAGQEQDRQMALCLCHDARRLLAQDDPAGARQELQRAAAILENAGPEERLAYVRAVLAAHAGERGQALESLRQALEAGLPVPVVQVDLDLAPLRGEPRLAELLDSYRGPTAARPVGRE